MSRRTRQEKQAEQITKAVAVAIIEVIPESMRSHRMINLDQPMNLELRPIVELRDNAVRHGLKKMIEGKRFSICDFDALCKAAKVYPPSDLNDILRPLHCHEWADMEPDFRNQIQQHIIACFVPVEVQATETTQPKGIQENE